jgi:hypothetical protein
MDFEHEPAGYQVCLYVGTAPAELAAARCIDVTPAQLSAESMIAALEAAGLTAADLRARTLLSLDCDAPTAVLAYTAVTGFAGRRLDALVRGALLDSASLFEAGQRLAAPRPASTLDYLQVGAARDDIRSITLDAALSPEDATTLRWARRVRFVPATDPAVALSQFIVVVAIRNRPAGERFPFLVRGDESASPADAPLATVGIDLDDVRNHALALRRSVRSGERDAQADFIEPTPRMRMLASAAALPIEETMRRLGARHNDETDLWHCPRPERHTHGDATASMRIQRGQVRCYRCDPERVDSLRLTMDVLGLSVDEAARWLLSGQERAA